MVDSDGINIKHYDLDIQDLTIFKETNKHCSLSGLLLFKMTDDIITWNYNMLSLMIGPSYYFDLDVYSKSSIPPSLLLCLLTNIP